MLHSSAAEYLTFIAASGQGGVQAVYADENVWLSQKMMGELYGVETHTINYHLKTVFADKELQEDAVIRSFRITAADGKSYNTQDEMQQRQLRVTAYLDLAESMAQRQIPMTMQDWETRLNHFLQVADREVLQDAGKVSAEIAQTHALNMDVHAPCF